MKFLQNAYCNLGKDVLYYRRRGKEVQANVQLISGLFTKGREKKRRQEDLELERVKHGRLDKGVCKENRRKRKFQIDRR